MRQVAKYCAALAAIALLMASTSQSTIPFAYAQVNETVIYCPEGTEPTYFGCQEPKQSVELFKTTRHWSALAYSAVNSAWWLASNHPKKKIASQTVLKQCQEGSGTNCQLMLTFSNQCAAVARVFENDAPSPGLDSVNTGSTADEAGENAKTSCETDWKKQCKVILTDCSLHKIESQGMSTP